MFAIIQQAGWPIWLLVITSVVAMILIIERLLSLRQSRIVPDGLLKNVLSDLRKNNVTPAMISKVEAHSPLGQILAAGLRNIDSPREVMKEAIEDAGRLVAHSLERFLLAIGTLATISPLLGLFGTIVGMIEIFASQSTQGANVVQLSHGISVALYNTGFGLIVAIPCYIFFFYFKARVNSFIMNMEQQAIKLVDAVHQMKKEKKD